MLFEIAAYDNEYADQGMRECKCGVAVPSAPLRALPREVLSIVRFFAREYRLGLGRWTLYRVPRGLGLTWSERGNDRCFGIEISQVKP